MTLVDAALLDQERRVLEAEPRSLREAGSCRICREAIGTNNTIGICSRSGECRTAYMQEYNRRKR